MNGYTSQSEVGRLRRVLLKTPAAAFRSDSEIGAQWRALNYLSPPDFKAAVAEYEALIGVLEAQGAELSFLPDHPDTGMDSIYVRDAAIVTDAGAILCRMGKAARRGEPAASGEGIAAGELKIRGTIAAPGMIEGGDVAWLNPETLAVGRGYRTTMEGIRQLRSLLPEGVEVVEVPLPHWQGPDDVFHLMSMLSPIDRDLMLVYSPLLPVPFREYLLEKGCTLIEVPPEEFDSMGCNVLALAPRVCLMLEGNPITRQRLEAAGAEVICYRGDEISRKGCGGPTCLTRPLLREL
jgi:N-dimethylarginine dimethylaminohydrolase